MERRLGRLEQQMAEVVRRLDAMGAPSAGWSDPAGPQADGLTDPDRVLRYIRAGQKVQAIKEVRDQTGMGLKQAKDLVDSLDNLR